MVKLAKKSDPATIENDGTSITALTPINQDLHEKRPLSADQVFLGKLHIAISNFPKIPHNALSNILQSAFSTTNTKLTEEKLTQVKSYVEENYKQIWDQSIKLLGVEIDCLVTDMKRLIISTAVSEVGHLTDSQNFAATILTKIQDGSYNADKETARSNIITDIAMLHERLHAFTTICKLSHPALIQLPVAQTASVAEPTIINSSAQVRAIFATGFKEHRLLFETIEKDELELQTTTGMSEQQISELKAKWPTKLILAATNSAKELGLNSENVYAILKTMPAGSNGEFEKAIGLLQEISKFTQSLNPIEVRVPELSPLASPEKFASAQDLLLATQYIKDWNSTLIDKSNLHLALKRTVAVEVITNLLIKIYREATKGASIFSRVPRDPARLLVYGYADKVDNNRSCILSDFIEIGSNRISHDKGIIFGHHGTRFTHISEDFSDLKQAKILVESDNSRFQLGKTHSYEKTYSTLAQTLPGPAGRYLAAIKEILKSIDKPDDDFIKAITAAEHLVLNKADGVVNEPSKKNKKPAKALDIVDELEKIGQALDELKSNSNPAKLKSNRDKINTLVTNITKQLKSEAQAADSTVYNNLSSFLSLIKPPRNPDEKYFHTAHAQLSKARELLLPSNLQDKQIQLKKLPSNSTPAYSSDTPKPILSISKPDIISHKLGDILSDLSPKLIAAAYVHKRLAELANLPNAQSELDKKLAAHFEGVLLKYLKPEEFAISQSHGIYIVTIFNDADIANDSDFIELCSEIAAAINSDVPFIVGVQPPSAAMLKNRQHPVANNQNLIPMSHECNVKHVSDKYHPNLGQIADTIKHILKLKPERPWLDVQTLANEIILKPKITLPNSAIDTIREAVCLFQIPIYLQQPAAPSASISWPEVKSIIKLMLHQSDSITSFRQNKEVGSALIKLSAASVNIKKLKSDLATLAETLKESELNLKYKITTLSNDFFISLKKFAPRLQTLLMKRRDPVSGQVRLDLGIDLNAIEVQEIELKERLKAYKDIANPRVVSGPNVKCVDPMGTKLAEDAFSVEVKDGEVEFGIHVVNGAFIVQPDTINRHLAYERLQSAYGKRGETFFMLPKFMKAGFSPNRSVPSISVFVRVPLRVLQNNASTDISLDNLIIEVTPSITKVGAKLEYSDPTQMIANKSNEDVAYILKLQQLSELLTRDSSQSSEAPNHRHDIATAVSTLMKYFNAQVAKFLRNQRYDREEDSTIQGVSGPQELFNKPYRDLVGLMGQHKLMAAWGFLPPMSQPQINELNRRIITNFKKGPVLRKSLELIKEIRQLLHPANSNLKVVKEADDNGRIVVKSSNSDITRSCYAQPSSYNSKTPVLGETIQVKNRRYDPLNDCFVMEY